MSNKIAEQARAALSAEGFPTRNNLCQKWARMVVQKAIGHRFDAVLQKPSAKEAAFSLANAGLAFPSAQIEARGGLKPGDLLYKTTGSGGFGHVGIYLGNGKVGENSTVHWLKSGKRDARGVRTLAQFGPFQFVARFPVPSAPVSPVQTFWVHGVQIEGATKGRDARWGGESFADVLAAAGLGFVTDTERTTPEEHHVRIVKVAK